MFNHKPRSLQQCALMLDEIAEFLDTEWPRKPYEKFEFVSRTSGRAYRLMRSGISEEGMRDFRRQEALREDLGYDPEEAHAIDKDDMEE